MNLDSVKPKSNAFWLFSFFFKIAHTHICMSYVCTYVHEPMLTCINACMMMICIKLVYALGARQMWTAKVRYGEVIISYFGHFMV